MNTLKLIFALLLYPVFLSAQLPYQPLIDSTAVCNPSYGHFYIVEEMPSPEQSLNDIENVLDQNVRFKKKELSIEGETYIQLMVNCKGVSGDYQLAKCPTDLTGLSKQIIEVLKAENIIWKPGKQRGKSVDVFVILQINVSSSNFKIVALH